MSEQVEEGGWGLGGAGPRQSPRGKDSLLSQVSPAVQRGLARLTTSSSVAVIIEFLKSLGKIYAGVQTWSKTDKKGGSSKYRGALNTLPVLHAALGFFISKFKSLYYSILLKENQNKEKTKLSAKDIIAHQASFPFGAGF